MKKVQISNEKNYRKKIDFLKQKAKEFETQHLYNISGYYHKKAELLKRNLNEIV